MIVCSCRNISSNDYDTAEELQARLAEDDFKCGRCRMKYSYSPNMMGPANLDWYKNNNIPYTIEMYECTLDGPDKGKMKEWTHYDQYAGGRLDVYCETCRGVEIGCPIMKATDWNKLHDFCDDFESEGLLTEKQFFGIFETYLGRPIEWGPGEKKFIDMIMERE
jgi:hypothetical protein